jgi:hypothetical protein
MTDDPRLFRSTLTPYRKGIKVGGGRIFSTHKGTAEMRLPDGKSASLSDVLYIPGLGINLLLAKKVCSNSAIKGTFDN